MTISIAMNVEVKTLVDITETKKNKHNCPDKLLVLQQANFNTFFQTLSLRFNPYYDASPVLARKELTEEDGFGSEYKGMNNVWTFMFRLETAVAGLDIEAIKDDFDLVPIIKNLNESIVINTSAFRTKDKQSTNIVFNRVDNTAE